jgi:FkbM family methyltransferase
MPSAKTLMKNILRAPLALLPSELEVRILRGPLRGKKWIVGAASHACWVGSYEADRLAAFATAIAPGDSVYDVGANVGIYTLLACVKTGPTGNVYAFEPVKRNLGYLRRHVVLNQLQNCCIVEAAVSDKEGTQRFSAAGWENSMGRLSDNGELKVPSVTIDSCAYGEGKLRPPDVIKIDVEGAEWHVLQGATRALSEHHPRMFVDVHGRQQHADCREFLASHGYQIMEEYGRLTATWGNRH